MKTIGEVTRMKKILHGTNIMNVGLYEVYITCSSFWAGKFDIIIVTLEECTELTCKCGQEASNVGSSSSGSKSGLSLGGNVRNILQAIWQEQRTYMIHYTYCTHSVLCCWCKMLYYIFRRILQIMVDDTDRSGNFWAISLVPVHKFYHIKLTVYL